MPTCNLPHNREAEPVPGRVRVPIPPRFLAFNAAGGVVWAAAYGMGAYLLGEQVRHVLGPVCLGLQAVMLVSRVGGYVFLRRHEKRLEGEAERALPGPLAPIVPWR